MNLNSETSGMNATSEMRGIREMRVGLEVAQFHYGSRKSFPPECEFFQQNWQT